jgi:hypothetical protein
LVIGDRRLHSLYSSDGRPWPKPHSAFLRAKVHIQTAMVASEEGEKAIKPILRPYDTVRSTRYVDFDTTRPANANRPDQCYISPVVCDTDSWALEGTIGAAARR